MTSPVRDTSLMAFMEVREDREHLGQMQMKVFEVIKANPYVSDLEISEILGIQINSITPRRNELLEMGFIMDCGTKKNKNNRLVHYWKSN